MDYKFVQQIYTFNTDVVGIKIPKTFTPLSPDESAWLMGALYEEANELSEAKEGIDMVDALVDSCIFAIGGLFRMGLTPVQVHYVFQAVMDANFRKKAGQPAKRAIGDVADAVKPEGFVGPEAELKKILEGNNR